VGSTAPFVGLFGTVWGIYHALTAIGIAGQASIDKVAGPVGEALIMTAIGLAIAVPAVMATTGCPPQQDRDGNRARLRRGRPRRPARRKRTSRRLPQRRADAPLQGVHDGDECRAVGQREDEAISAINTTPLVT